MPWFAQAVLYNSLRDGEAICTTRSPRKRLLVNGYVRSQNYFGQPQRFFENDLVHRLRLQALQPIDLGIALPTECFRSRSFVSQCPLGVAAPGLKPRELHLHALQFGEPVALSLFDD